MRIGNEIREMSLYRKSSLFRGGFVVLLKKVSIYFPLIFSLFLITSCSTSTDVSTKRLSLGAWVVYWDGNRGMDELEKNSGLFSKVSLFAYEMGPNGSPRHAPKTKDLIPRFIALAKQQSFSPWVTIVNDTRIADDKVLLKDLELTRKLCSDSALIRSHVVEIADMVQRDGFSGLDLDYERLEAEDQENFRLLVKEFSNELKKRGLGFNITLEPLRGPLPLPGTLPITVMGYNQYGTHSGPGPRATPEFLEKIGKRVAPFSNGRLELAIAVAGFSWTEGGKTKQIDWGEAQKLYSSARVERSLFTKVPHVKLSTGTEIWFDDADSMKAKLDAALRAGYSGIMIWRLGGNDESLFKILREYRKEVNAR